MDNNMCNINTKDKKTQEIEIEDENTKNIEYEFSLFDKMISKFFNCCLTRKLKIKSYLTRQAESLLNSKLDIALNIRNMMLFDIMNETVRNSETKDIINFLTRPIISYKYNKEELFIIIIKKRT